MTGKGDRGKTSTGTGRVTKKPRPETARIFLDLWKEIASAPLAPVYILYGSREDRDQANVQFLVDRTLTLVRRRFLADPTGKYNLDVFDGRILDAEAVLASVRTVPMFGASRLTIVTGISEPDDAATDRLVGYLRDPVPTGILVLAFDSGSLPRRLHAAAKETSRVARAERLRDRDMPGWIEARFADHGLGIAQGVTRALAEHTGTSLDVVEDTIERLSLYAHGKPRVEVSDVEECVLDVRESEMFDLLDAIGARDPGRALAVLARIGEQRGGTLVVNSMLANQIRKLILIRGEGGRLPDKETLVRETGYHPFYAGKLLDQARNFSPRDLERALSAAVEFNVESKRSRAPAERLLEAMVLRIITGQES